MILILILIIIVLTIVISWIRMVRDSRRINVKGPFPLPVLGNAHLFMTKPSEYLNLLKNFSLKYGDAFRVNFLSDPIVILSHPKYVEPLLSNTELLQKGRAYDFLVPWLGQSLLIATGERWHSLRKFLTPAFHYNILQSILPVFCKNQNMLTEKLRGLADGRSFDLVPIVAVTALENVSESIMGIPVQKHRMPEFLKTIDDLVTIASMRLQIPFLANDQIFNLSPYKKKFNKGIKYLHEYTTKVIEARREELKKTNITKLDQNNEKKKEKKEKIGLKNKHAFLDLLLLAEIDGKGIDDVTLRQEVETFMVGGYDTTATTIAFSLYCLSMHGDVQEKLFEEQRKILGGEMIRDPAFSELKQMKYLESVIKESMRLYPAVPFIQRRITKKCNVGELKLTEGTTVMVNIFQTHRHPDVFEEPLEFRPERFDQPLENPVSWLPFSAGPRNCIGQKFAMLVLTTSISAMIKNFRILPADEKPVLCANMILKSTNGVHVRLLPRKLLSKKYCSDFGNDNKTCYSQHL